MLNLNGVNKASKPCHVSTNEHGEVVKWWLCPSLNEWARHCGVNVRCWVVEIAGRDSYVLTDETKVIFETQLLEDAACHIDIMKLDKTIPCGKIQV